MGQFKRLINNRIILGSIISTLLLVVAASMLILASISGWPHRFFRFDQPAPAVLASDVNIAGSAEFDKNSYLIGELATYRISLYWRVAAVTPDVEAFKNGIGFFPFNRRQVTEIQRQLGDGINEYRLEIQVQAVDVEPTRSYQLAPPTAYYTVNGSTTRDIQSYNIKAPIIHIGEFYPANVSAIPLQDYKGRIHDPRIARQLLMSTTGLVLLLIAAGLLWYFGRVRKAESLPEPERLWHQYRQLDRHSLSNRAYMDQCERIFTGLLRFRLHLSPVLFWSGQDPDTAQWKDICHQARELLYQNYLPEVPDNETVSHVSRILDDMFARLTEEERLLREQNPTFYQRVASQFGVVTTSSIILLCGMLVLVLTALPQYWLSKDVAEYNRAISLLQNNGPIENIYEYFSKLPERINDPRIKAAALYNFGIVATRPEFAELNNEKQEAMLAVMFQEQKVFLDALLHSLNMEDPFLLVAILRDSVRYLTISEASFKAATRISPEDESIRRNLELVQKRRNAYADSIQEIVQGGDDPANAGQLQRQAIMDLDALLQTEVPDKFTDAKDAKNNKDYFILEGF